MYTWAMDFCVLIIIMANFFFGILFCTFFILKPGLPHLFGNVLAVDRLYNFPITYLFPCYATMISVMQLGILMVLAFFYGSYLVPVFVREFWTGRKSYKTLPSLRSANNLRVMFRSAQIVQQQVNAAFGKFLFPSQALITIVTILPIFSLIKYQNAMESIQILLMVTIAIMSPLFWGAILVAGGSLHSDGNKVINSWKYHAWESPQEIIEMNKFRVSCKTVMLAFGNTFMIRRVTIMNFIRGLSRGTVRALLIL